MTVGAPSLSLSVVTAVADAERLDPIDLVSPLAEAIDPDALDALFRNGTGRVSFDYCGYRVTVDANGTVDVSPLAEA